MKCPRCGSETPDGARFCQNCGTELGASPAAAPPVGSLATAPESDQIPAIIPPATPPVLPYPMIQPPPYPPPPYPIVPGSFYAVPRSGKAIAGFWLGIASIIPGAILSWIGIIIGIVGIILSAIGLSEARRISAATGLAAMRVGRRFALWGITLSILGVIASTAVLAYFLSNLDKYNIQFTR